VVGWVDEWKDGWMMGRYMDEWWELKATYPWK
jgi:hypothetical protein